MPTKVTCRPSHNYKQINLNGNSHSDNITIYTILHLNRGTRWCSWLRHCTTSRKVSGSIPDGVTGIFHWHNLSGIDSACNKNEYQEYLLRSKSGRCVGLTTLPPSCADCLEIWEPQASGTLRACPGLCFTSLLLQDLPPNLFLVSWPLNMGPKRRYGITTTRWEIAQKSAAVICFALVLISTKITYVYRVGRT